jgi:acetyl-CoA acetyltransferase
MTQIYADKDGREKQRPTMCVGVGQGIATIFERV